ncbi:MAG: radical SAM protein [Deltaproteobacteria bacterium]|nr:radical SAM protein [Deltaproteobacteria bacterium]
MDLKNNTTDTHTGFEQGPIRPPSEANSLLIRLTRNCPWNHCTFCPVYKGEKFSLREIKDVKRDIDVVARFVEHIKQLAEKSEQVSRAGLIKTAESVAPEELQAFQAAVNWFAGGLSSIFLQDANSLIMKPSDLADILHHIKKCFPWVERVTSYARSHTISLIKDDDMKMIAQAGLNRIHIGLESGSDQVLKMVKKGATKEIHIKAGKKVKNAGIELSEYVMPGLGGKKLSDIHAIETADALNQINPDFIRLRTLAIPEHVPLYEEYKAGRFEKCDDKMMANEIYTFIENLDGIESVVKSDHILNLCENVQGTLPEDKEKMLSILQSFLDMDPDQQCVYQVGRRLGLFSGPADMENAHRFEKANKARIQFGITPENADEMIHELMKRFI